MKIISQRNPFALKIIINFIFILLFLFLLGQIEMEAEILQHFDIPAFMRKQEMEEFPKLVYLTQVSSSESIIEKSLSIFYRQPKGWI